MTPVRAVAVWVALFAAWCAVPPAQASPDALSAGLLADLPNFKDYTAHRESSHDPTGGNADGRHDWPLQPGETRTLADIAGAGAITHLWITIASPDPDHLRNLVLRMYWDGEEAPSVESPIGDFFGLGHGRYYQYASLPIQIGVDKGLNCFWRMPFSDGARITVTNDGPRPAGAFYYYVNYQRFESLPETGRFHAQYRQAMPCVKGEPYVLMEAKGRGHYVGCNLSIHTRAGAWWGEGDDMIYVDGDPHPTLYGTGSEDYFGGAWCYGVDEGRGEPFGNLYLGCPLLGENKPNSLWNVYRYHIEDPVPFKESIRVTIEHGHANMRTDDFSSVAYWYQDEPHAPFPPLPQAEDRMHTPATVFVESYAYEGEDLASAFADPRVVKQETAEYGNHWSEGAFLLFRADAPTTFRADLPTYPSDAGNYRLEVWYTAGPDYGQCELWLNGERICAWDGYHPGGLRREKVEEVAPIAVQATGNVLELRVVGKHPESKGYNAGYDCYRPTPR